MSNVGDKLG